MVGREVARLQSLAELLIYFGRFSLHNSGPLGTLV